MRGRRAPRRLTDLPSVAAELEQALPPHRYEQVKRIGRAARSARRRAERARFRSDADYFDFLIARAVRRGADHQPT